MFFFFLFNFNFINVKADDGFRGSVSLDGTRKSHVVFYGNLSTAINAVEHLRLMRQCRSGYDGHVDTAQTQYSGNLTSKLSTQSFIKGVVYYNRTSLSSNPLPVIADTLAT